MKWVIIITTEDGTQSVQGPFPNEIQADGYAAYIELNTEGSLAGQATPLETPELTGHSD